MAVAVPDRFTTIPGDFVWDTDIEPVSFAEKTDSGKIKIRIADLVKVGPEGYIHGYICVRPPCGQYTEATFNSSKGTVEHDGERIGKMRKNTDGTYSMTHFAQGVFGAGEQKTRLFGKYATRPDAAKSLALYHNMTAMQSRRWDATWAGSMNAAVDAMGTGKHELAAKNLDDVAADADDHHDLQTATHARDLAAAVRSVKVADEVPRPAPAPKPSVTDVLDDEAAKRAIHDLLLTPTSSPTAESFVGLAESAMRDGSRERAAIHLTTAAIAARKDGDDEFGGKADALARKLNGELKPDLRFDFTPHIATLQSILDDPEVKHNIHASHVDTQLSNAIGYLHALSNNAFKDPTMGFRSVYNSLQFGEQSARYVHLDDIADRIRIATDKLKDDYDAYDAAKTAAMAPGWEKDLKSDPKYKAPKNGFQVQALDKNGVPLSLHPTAEKEGSIPRYFATEHDVDDFVRDNASAYRYDPFWQAHQRAKPTIRTKVSSYGVAPVEDGVIQNNMSEHRTPGEVVDYGGFGDSPSDVIASQPIRFAPYAKDKYVTTVDPSKSASKRAELAAEIRSQFKHQDALVSSVVRNTRIIVTDSPQTKQKPNTLADYLPSQNEPFQGRTRLTPDIFSAMEGANAAKVLRDGKRSGWWVPTDDKWTLADNVIAHEVGHGVAAKALRTAEVPQDPKFWNDFAHEAGLYTVPTHLGQHTGLTSTDVSDWITRNKPTMMKAVSEYGTKNADEMMAELWSEYTLNNHPRMTAKLYGDYVSSIIKTQESGPPSSTYRGAP